MGDKRSVRIKHRLTVYECISYIRRRWVPGFYVQLKYFCRNPPFTNGISHGHQFFKRALLHRTFSFVMNEQGALFGLFLGMPAYFNQRIDHVVESIDIVIEND